MVVAGDGRCDTAGHSAIYGLYSLMDCETNFILSAKLVKVVETICNSGDNNSILSHSTVHLNFLHDMDWCCFMYVGNRGIQLQRYGFRGTQEMPWRGIRRRLDHKRVSHGPAQNCECLCSQEFA